MYTFTPQSFPTRDTLNFMQRDRLHQLLIPRLLIGTAALIAVLPLIIYGPSCGHDFDFHLLNWLEAAQQFTHGNLHPHWAYTPAYHAGEPRFVFYPPLSWTIGAIFGLLFQWTWTPILYTWLILTAAGISLHRLARAFASPNAALLAAVFYLVNPYMLFTAYERTAYAELLAAVWIPLLLLAILREQITIPRIALPVALLWLTNAPAAAMSSYALALLTLVRLLSTPRTITMPGAPSSPRSLRLRWASRESAAAPAHLNHAPTPRTKLALTTITGTILGISLAAFYILPAAYERRYVQITMAILPGLRIQDNTLFHHLAATITDPAALPDALLHDAVLHTASLIAVILITLATLALLAAFKQTKTPCAPYIDSDVWASTLSASRMSRPLLLPLVILTATIAFLLTPLSNIFWQHLPELAFLQFPWRTLAILAAVLSLSIALTLNRLKLNTPLTATAALAAAVILTIPAYKTFNQPCDAEDSVPARVALFHSNQGTEPTDEYTPTTADNDALTHNNPPYWLSPNPNAPAPTNAHPGLGPTHLTFASPIPQTLILNLRNYPAWQVTLNKALITTRQKRDDGLIAIPIPPGPATIAITYTRLKDQTIGAVLSILSLLTLALLTMYRRATPST